MVDKKYIEAKYFDGKLVHIFKFYYRNDKNLRLVDYFDENFCLFKRVRYDKKGEIKKVEMICPKICVLDKGLLSIYKLVH
ncbi:hypothetical protein [Candidatus Phytoplasma pini]|uniref:DUF2963 domain-containing protein n=1 Tax=Candidatus Phytoplasma pini TaxID=267362 RepID=A0A559KIX2_9MOLU|nr:hypothetical protein [Candidatus Phytoplasma pini]TVY12084.1 hypothetical protein MDPP_00371 [Candidatus Phytoplasma pini]